jgi:hypothetical protein
MTRFVTRAQLHVDRIATAWAIRRFVDPHATFEFVDRVRDVSALGAIPFDVRGAELGHHDGRCTFEALIAHYELKDPALARMGPIIRGADLRYEDDVPAESAGVAAIFDGLRDAEITDEERLARGSIVCDALYAYCLSARE